MYRDAIKTSVKTEKNIEATQNVLQLNNTWRISKGQYPNFISNTKQIKKKLYFH